MIKEFLSQTRVRSDRHVVVASVAKSIAENLTTMGVEPYGGDHRTTTRCWRFLHGDHEVTVSMKPYNTRDPEGDVVIHMTKHVREVHAAA